MLKIAEHTDFQFTNLKMWKSIPIELKDFEFFKDIYPVKRTLHGHPQKRFRK